MELMGPEPSSIRSPNARLQIRLKKKRYLGILEGLILSTTYGLPAQNMHLKAVFSPVTIALARQVGIMIFFFFFIHSALKGGPTLIFTCHQ